MRRCALSITVCSVVVFLNLTLHAQRGASGGQWPNHSGDKGSTKYAPLDQINRNNVGNLRIAWRRPAVADELRSQHPNLRFSNLFHSTPLLINGVLYASNGIGVVEAFDPATGKTLWVQELSESGPETLNGAATRSIAYWRRGSDERILSVRSPYLWNSVSNLVSRLSNRSSMAATTPLTMRSSIRASASVRASIRSLSVIGRSFPFVCSIGFSAVSRGKPCAPAIEFTPG